MIYLKKYFGFYMNPQSHLFHHILRQKQALPHLKFQDSANCISPMQSLEKRKMFNTAIFLCFRFCSYLTFNSVCCVSRRNTSCSCQNILHYRFSRCTLNNQSKRQCSSCQRHFSIYQLRLWHPLPPANSEFTASSQTAVDTKPEIKAANKITIIKGTLARKVLDINFTSLRFRKKPSKVISRLNLTFQG